MNRDSHKLKSIKYCNESASDWRCEKNLDRGPLAEKSVVITVTRMQHTRCEMVDQVGGSNKKYIGNVL